MFLPKGVQRELLSLVGRGGISRARLTQGVNYGSDLLDHFLDRGASGLNSRGVVHVTETFGISASFLLNMAAIPSEGGCRVSRLNLSTRTTEGLCAKGTGTRIIGCLLRDPHFLRLACVLRRCFGSAIATKCTTRGRLCTALDDLAQGSTGAGTTTRTTGRVGHLGAPICRTSLTAVRGRFVVTIGRIGGRVNGSFTTVQTVATRRTRGVFSRVAGNRSVRGLAIAPGRMSSLVVNDMINVSYISPSTLGALNRTLANLFRSAFSGTTSQRGSSRRTRR